MFVNEKKENNIIFIFNSFQFNELKKANLENRGLTSIDRSNEAALLITVPRSN